MRKTTCEQLLQANEPPTLIQNITGHKNVQSISNYAKASKRSTTKCKKYLQEDLPIRAFQAEASIAGSTIILEFLPLHTMTIQMSK